MGDTAQTLGVAGRPTTPTELLRQIAPDHPVLLVGRDDIWEPTGIEPCLAAAGWASLRALDPDRASWLASIQKVSLVLVAGDAALVWPTCTSPGSGPPATERSPPCTSRRGSRSS